MPQQQRTSTGKPGPTCLVLPLPDDFVIRLDAEGVGDVVVAVSGEVDLATGEALWTALQEASSHGRSVLLDLTGTTFIDSSGLTAIARAHKLLAGQGGRVTVRARGGAAVMKVLTISGIDKLVPIERT